MAAYLIASVHVSDPEQFKRYAALTPGLRWLPAAGTDVGRDDPRTRRPDFFRAALDVEVPAEWLVAGPGKRTEVGAAAGRKTFRFAPAVELPKIALMAGELESYATEIDGVTFEALVHPKHTQNFTVLADARAARIVVNPEDVAAARRGADAGEAAERIEAEFPRAARAGLGEEVAIGVVRVAEAQVRPRGDRMPAGRAQGLVHPCGARHRVADQVPERVVVDGGSRHWASPALPRPPASPTRRADCARRSSFTDGRRCSRDRRGPRGRAGS